MRKHIDIVNLNSEQLAILHKVMQDPFFFATFIYLIHPIRGKTIFDLYPFQKKLLWHFLHDRFNVILKFRQAGVTELISLFALWMAMYHPHKNVVIISIKDRVAKKVLRKIKFMYKNLPDFLKVKIVNSRGDSIGTATDIEFTNGSVISSIPTTEDAGRSEAVSLLIIDEAAIVRWADRIWAASWPTLSTGGRAIVNSTPYGVGNFYHKLFTEAVSGGNEFNPIRLFWQMHPERDGRWYKQMADILGPRKTAQEIDGDFLTSGNTVFDLADIRDIEELIDEEPPLSIDMNGMLRIYKEPDPEHYTFIGADVSTGRANDFSAASCMDETGDEYWSFKGRIPINIFEDLLVKMGTQYRGKQGRAFLAPESNDIGLGLATNLQTNGYEKLWYSRALLKRKGESRPKQDDIPGWYTTKKNRPVIIAQLEEDIRNDTCTIRDKAFCDEAYTFIYDNMGRPVAMNKDKQASDDVLDDTVYSDDAIFAKAITNHIRQQPINSIIIAPK
jgi:hypothetical protein